MRIGWIAVGALALIAALSFAVLLSRHEAGQGSSAAGGPPAIEAGGGFPIRGKVAPSFTLVGSVRSNRLPLLAARPRGGAGVHRLALRDRLPPDRRHPARGAAPHRPRGFEAGGAGCGQRRSSRDSRGGRLPILRRERDASRVDVPHRLARPAQSHLQAVQRVCMRRARRRSDTRRRDLHHRSAGARAPVLRDAGRELEPSPSKARPARFSRACDSGCRAGSPPPRTGTDTASPVGCKLAPAGRRVGTSAGKASGSRSGEAT